MAKDGKEKLEIIKNLDNSSTIKEILKKKPEEFNDNDFENIIKYRYKYALPKRRIRNEFDLTRAVLDNREKKVDEELKTKLEILNEYNNRFNYYTYGRSK